MSESYKQTFINGRYEKIFELGLGGASACFFCLRSHRTKALCSKIVISSSVRSKKEKEQRLRREVETMKQVSHRNIAESF